MAFAYETMSTVLAANLSEEVKEQAALYALGCFLSACMKLKKVHKDDDASRFCTLMAETFTPQQRNNVAARGLLGLPESVVSSPIGMSEYQKLMYDAIASVVVGGCHLAQVGRQDACDRVRQLDIELFSGENVYEAAHRAVWDALSDGWARSFTV